MLFRQSSAPTGWTKVTSTNDATLRVVSGNVSSGGSAAFSSTFTSRTPTGSLSGSLSGATIGGTTLTTSQMPSHNHGIQRSSDDEESQNKGFNDDRGNRVVAYKYTTSAGGNGSHTHSLTGGSISGSVSMNAMDFAVKYVDVIIATIN